MRRVFFALGLLLLVTACDHDNPLEPGNDLLVTTDKSMYAVGEQIEWTLANNADASTWIRTCPGFTIERYDGGHWSTAAEYLPMCIAVVLPPIELTVGEKVTSDLLGQTIDPGVYRVGAEVFEDEHVRGFTVIYSKPFMVR